MVLIVGYCGTCAFGTVAISESLIFPLVSFTSTGLTILKVLGGGQEHVAVSLSINYGRLKFEASKNGNVILSSNVHGMIIPGKVMIHSLSLA